MLEHPQTLACSSKRWSRYAGGGQFTTCVASDHLRSNAALIEKFLPVDILCEAEADGWRVRVLP